MSKQNADPVDQTRHWVEAFVIGLNLCPFAKKEFVQNRIRFELTRADSTDQLLDVLKSELELLSHDSDIETTLLIHPDVLTSFEDYNQFLNLADALLISMDLEGVFQIASFHPDYQFAGTSPADPENYTNRSPFPTLHILREDSLEKAIDQYPDVDLIPARNIAKMNELGITGIQLLLSQR